MKIDQWRQYFPFKSVRKEQEDIINFVLEQFESGKRFVIVEASTGVGKSAIAVTVGKYFSAVLPEPKGYAKGSWFVTNQKILQNQYVKDFGPPKGDMASVKSASNYTCDFFTKNKCSDSIQLLKEADPDSKFYKSCSFKCKYKSSKRNFLASSLSVTNFPYFLTESAGAQAGIKPRQILILDEAHTIEDELGKFTEVNISERFASTILKLDMPELRSQAEAAEWIRKKYFPRLTAEIEALTKELSDLRANGDEDSDEAKRITTNIDRLGNHSTKVSKFLTIYHPENWVFNIVPPFQNSGRKLEFKTIDVGEYAEEFLYRFGEKTLILSATILDKDAFCESIGIKSEDAAFISVESSFNHENAPTIFLPVGSMNMANLDKTLPELARAVKAIMENHPNEKGIIHTRTFKIAKYLKDHIKSDRLIMHETGDREQALENHAKSKKPTVFLSPSSTEGLDLKDDLSRFQVICKLHWPYLGDELVKKRMEKYKHWYTYQAVKSLIQARGRSIRTENDYAVTYILDQDFERLYSKNIKMFPKYFKKSLHID